MGSSVILVYDNDCHSYLIPLEEENNWYNWLSTYDDCVPNFAERIDNPHNIVIHNYSVRGV